MTANHRGDHPPCQTNEHLDRALDWAEKLPPAVVGVLAAVYHRRPFPRQSCAYVGGVSCAQYAATVRDVSLIRARLAECAG